MYIRERSVNIDFGKYVLFSYIELKKIYDFLKNKGIRRTTNFLPKSLSFCFDDTYFSHSYIKKYSVIKKSFIDTNGICGVNEKSDSISNGVVEEYKVVYIGFNDLEDVLKIVLEPFLVPSNRKISVRMESEVFVDGDNCCRYDFDITKTVFLGDKHTEVLLKYKNYFDTFLDELNKRNSDNFIEVDLELLRENYNVFNNLVSDETMFVLPVVGNVYSFKGINILTFDYNDKEDKNDYMNVSVRLLSKEEHESYSKKLSEHNLSNINLCVLYFEDLSDVVSVSKNILSNSVVKCYIKENIDGDIVRIKRIINSIEKILQGNYSNEQLINIICSNNLFEYFDESKLYAYKKNNNYITCLGDKYPKLKNNKEQLIAIDKIVQMKENRLPLMLVQGPPGTGKTELILALVKELFNKKMNILVTSNVQVACDNVVERIKNEKELILKRYKNFGKSDKYNDEITNNQKNYMINQVLAGFQYKGVTIDSKEKFDELKNKELSISNEIKQMKNRFDEDSINFNNYLELNNELKKIDNLIEENIKKTNEDNSKILELIGEKNNINSECLSITDNLDLINNDLNTKSRLILDLSKDRDDYFDKINISKKKLNDLEDDLKIRKLKYSTKEEQLNDFDKRINKLAKEYSYLEKFDFDKEIITCCEKIENNNRWTSNITKYFVNLLEIEKIYNLRKTLESFDYFWNNNEEINDFDLEKIWYNKNNLYFKTFRDNDTCKCLELVFNYNKLSFTNRLKINLFSSTVDGISKRKFLENKKLLFDYFKHIQYDYKNVIRDIFFNSFNDDEFFSVLANKKSEYFSVIEKKDKFLLEIENFDKDVVDITDSIETLKKEISSLCDLHLNIGNEIIKLNDQKDLILNDINKQSSKINELRQLISENDAKISVLENDKTNLGNEYLTLIDNKNKINFNIQEEIRINGDKLDEFIKFRNKYEIDLKNKNAELKYLKDFIKDFNDKIVNIAGKKNIDNGYEIIFGYINELSKLIDVDDNLLDKYLVGKGSLFRNTFRLDNDDTSHLVSMTTNQISKFLKANDKMEFDYVIVDEASKCCFEDLIVSLPKTKHLVLIGDYMQLNRLYDDYSSLSLSIQNIIGDENTWKQLNDSSFSMLLEQLVNYNDDKKILSFENNSIVSVLNKQYRMNKGIFNIISPIYTIHKGFEIFDGKDYSGNDVKCIDIKGEREQYGDSSLNWGEISFIVRLLNSIQENRNLYPQIKTIGVITGYRAQANHIRYNLKTKIKGLEIGTFDRFQGREYDLVIVSMVRTDKLGFLSDVRRMNVAFSRTKSHLLIVGNFDALLKCAEKESSNIVIDNNISDSKQRELLFVCHNLVPTIYNMREVYVSDEERIDDVVKFLKENNYE